MIHVVPILWGALFTIATAWSLGMLFFRKLSLPIQGWEERFLAYIAGSACLSAIMFILCATRLVRRGILLVLGLAIIAYAIYSGVLRFSGKRQPPLSKLWLWLFGLGFTLFTYFGFFNALAPEHSSDGMAYHLNEVAKYSRAHGFFRITTDIYASLSQGIELIYLFAYDFGRHSAATVVHYSFLVALVFLILCYGRRIGRPDVGAAAALFTYACPIVLRDASIAYVDVALAANLFALFYFLQIWDENRDSRLLIPIGLLAGFGYEIKYTAIVAVPYAVGFVAWKLWRDRKTDRKPVLRPVLLVSAIALSCILPWMVKDWIEVANPVAPLANRIFPNPYVHVAFEDNWRASLTTYTLASRSQIPLQVTVQGDHVEGFLGPLFLLSPLALIALRYRVGRQLLLAAAIFGSTYLGNIGTRFLIPVVPFISLALALVFADVEWLLPTVAVVHCLTCMPDLYSVYCAPGAYRIESVPLKAALRIEPEAVYLGRDPTIQVDRMVEANVPADETIFSVNQGGQSYLPRDLLVGYESASNEVVQDILWTPVVQEYQPTRILRFDFPAREVRKIRVVQTASVPDRQWAVSELRIFNGAMELPRSPAWRLTAQPNPWDIQLAFDNSPVTRWRSWQPAEPGMYIEVDLGAPQTISSVVVESSNDTGPTKIKLDGISSAGAWNTISDHPVESGQPVRASLRLAATAEIKARGIRYLLILPDNPGADDMLRYARYWGLTPVGSFGDVHLFHLN